MAKGRPSFLVNIQELRDTITKLESVKTYGTQSELFAEVANTDWAKSQPLSNGKSAPLSSQMIYNLIKKNGIVLKTEKGKIFGGERASRQPRAKSVNADAYRKHQLSVINSCGFKSSKTDKLVKLFNRAAAGKMRAVLKLHCLNCVGFEETHLIGTEESCGQCPLYPLTRKA